MSPFAGRGSSFQEPLSSVRKRSNLIGGASSQLMAHREHTLSVPRLKFKEGTERLRVVHGEFEELLEGEEVRVPAAVLEGVEDDLLGLCELTELLGLREVCGDRLVDED